MGKLEFNWEYPKKLEPVFSYEGRYIVLTGGRSSGKSHFLARKFLEDRLHQKRDLLCLREYQRNLEQSNYKLFKSLIDLYKLPFKKYADKFVSLTTGAEIVFEGMNNLTQDNIKSYEGFADAWIEEGQNFSKESFELLDPTIREIGSKIYVSMNPKRQKDEVLMHIKYTFPALIIHINYNENPFCPDDMRIQAEAYKKNKPDEYRHIWLGEPKQNFENLVVYNWSSDNEHKIAYQEDMDLHITCDFNYSPNCWILAHKTDTKAFFFKEYCKDMRTEDLIRVVLDDYPHNGRIIINGDASGNRFTSNSKHSDYDLIRNELVMRGYRPEGNDCQTGKRFVFHLPNANGSRKARFDAWNAKVKTLNGDIEIYIDPKKCPQLIMNMTELQVVAGTSDFAMPTKSELIKNPDLRFLGHPFDAASYLVNKYWAIKPVYKDYTVQERVYSEKERFNI